MERTKEYRKLLLGVLGSECAECGAKKNLIIHHKRYGDDVTLKDLTVVCRNCHPHKKKKRKAKFELIGIEEARKKELDKLKAHPRETYDEVVRKLIEDRKNNQEAASHE